MISGMDMFHIDELLSRLKERIVKPLSGLKVVPYYGCLAVRPVEVVEPADPENPMQMDHILEALGAEVLSWPYKTDCCGGSLALTRTDLVLKLSRKLLDMALTRRSGCNGDPLPHVPGQPGHPPGGHLAGDREAVRGADTLPDGAYRCGLRKPALGRMV